MAVAMPGLRRFEYLRPSSINEAIEFKASAGPDAYYWAGGTDIALEWKRQQRTISHCIDLTYVPNLRGIDVSHDRIRIGALTSLATLERATGQQPLLDVLAAISRVMCTPQTRTIATVAGNLCNASPAADLAPPLIAFEAQITVRNQAGERTIPLEQLFVGVKRTVLEGEDLVTELSFPVGACKRGAYSRIARTVVDIALALAATAVDLDENGRVALARVALGSVAPTPIRVPEAETILLGLGLDSVSETVIKDAAAAAAEKIRPITDVRTTAAYRKEATRVLVRRSLDQTFLKLRERRVD